MGSWLFPSNTFKKGLIPAGFSRVSLIHHHVYIYIYIHHYTPWQISSFNPVGIPQHTSTLWSLNSWVCNHQDSAWFALSPYHVPSNLGSKNGAMDPAIWSLCVFNESKSGKKHPIRIQLYSILLGKKKNISTVKSSSPGMKNPQFAWTNWLTDGEWLTGWWYTYPSEKYERQLGWWHSQYMDSHKLHVPNHQPR